MSEKEGTVQEFEQTAKDGVKASKYGVVNTMTIPQLRRAKEVMKKKLGEPDINGQTKQKMEDMIAEYERAEKQIYRYFSVLSGHPQGKSLIAGGKLKTLDTLTIQNIKGLKEINNKDMGKINTGLANKIALGTGIAMIGAGVMTMGKEDASLFALLVQLIQKLSVRNKIGLGLITAGIATIGATYIIKKAKEVHRKNMRAQQKVYEAENDLYEQASANESSIDEVALAGAKFEGQSLDNMANALLENPRLMAEYRKIAATGKGRDGKIYTVTQQRNIVAALDRANALQKELDDKIKEYNDGLPKDPEETEKGDDKKETPKTTSDVETARKKLAGILTPKNNTKEAREEAMANIDKFIEDITKEGLSGPEIEALKKIAEERKKAIENIKDGRKDKLADLTPEQKKALGIEEEPARA